MEDPNRMRTKLRLDLRDVNQQIADLEKTMSKDKNSELRDQHAKLENYRDKLTEQYENITGLEYYQTSTISYKAGFESEDASNFGRWLGFFAGIALANGYYNLILHSIGLYDYNSLFQFLEGTKSRVIFDIGGMLEFAIKITAPSLNLVIFGLASPIFIELLRSLLSKSRAEMYSLAQTIAITIPGFYLAFVILLPTSESLLLNDYIIMVYILGSSGVLFLLSMIGTPGIMGKVSAIICGLLFLMSTYNANLLVGSPTLSTQFVSDFPYIFGPILGVGIVLSIAYLFNFIKD